ncbi:hypothetical protein [Microbacterium sp. BK668]|uniref:TRAP transporter substrate-binding protein n=1 Tax=Microbacterium sp. BK668 TaxID=2512118 RepID=UPI00105BDB9E|nr:hypothetical protein [Microbacterium sp. BK668]TDN91343.1 TRAP-type C4-dicarboxylate transport system substrate-binding protein [Microbacterium sp. BK668]
MLARRCLGIIAATGAVAALAGCGSVSASKSGGGVTAETVTLLLADGEGRPASDAARIFADALEDISSGALMVEVEHRAHLGDRADEPGAENEYEGVPYEDVTRMLLDGAGEVAVVPDFTLAEAGAASLLALKAPFAVDSDALMTRVAEQLSDRLLEGIDELGARGLALLPESLRHPVGFSAPFESVPDFAGASLRVVDPYVGRTLEALGATAVQLEGDFGEAVFSGRVQGAESAFAQRASLPVTGIFTSDVTLGAKFNVVVASGPWFATLAPQEREWVERAAERTREEVLAAHRTDPAEGAVYCDEGGWVVHAGSAAQRDLLDRVRPIVDQVTADPVAGPLFEDVLALRDELADAPRVATPCEPELTTTAAAPPDTAGVFPEGTYRAELTVEDFTSAGVDASFAHDHDGIWTLTFRDGRVWDIGCPGSTYAVVGDRVVVTLGRGEAACGSVAGQELFSARWDLEDGVLRFLDVGPGANGPSGKASSEVLWGSQDWVRIR